MLTEFSDKIPAVEILEFRFLPIPSTPELHSFITFRR